MNPVRRYGRRRIGTVNNVEVHQDLSAKELGWPQDWPFSFIRPGEFSGWGTSRLLTDFTPGTGSRFEFLSKASDGRIAGAAIVEIPPEEPSTVRIAWVESLSPGHGTRLVRAVERWAAERGHATILLQSRHASYGFWVRMGYKLHPESVVVIEGNRDLYSEVPDEDVATVARDRLIPDILFKTHPGALPDPIKMVKELR